MGDWIQGPCTQALRERWGFTIRNATKNQGVAIQLCQGQ